MASVGIRPATIADLPFLWVALFYASHADEDAGVGVDDLAADPVLARYLAGWGRPGDLGLVAEEAGAPIGAAWARLPLPEDRASYAYVDDETAEVAVAVLPGRVGEGVGTRLLTALIETSVGSYRALTLTVRDTNPARRLYERLGFVAIGELENRIGGRSVKMVRQV